MLIDTSGEGVNCTRLRRPPRDWHARPPTGKMDCCTAQTVAGAEHGGIPGPPAADAVHDRHTSPTSTRSWPCRIIPALTPTRSRRYSRKPRDLQRQVLSPANAIGDRKGVQVVDQAVQVPAEFTAAYAQFREAGWTGIALNPDFGGQGLPKTVSIACEEMWAAANVAFALCPELSQGAIMALDRHGSDALKQAYLEKLISGRVDRHDVPDRTAGGLGPCGADHARRAARRPVLDHRAARSSSRGATIP